MEIYKNYETSRKGEKDGIKIYLDAEEKVYMVLARAGGTNIAFMEGMEELSKIDKGFRSNKASIQKMYSNPKFIKMCSDTLVKGWGGLLGKDGKSLKYSKEVSRKLLMDLPTLFEAVFEAAYDVNNYLTSTLTDEDKEELGKS